MEGNGRPAIKDLKQIRSLSQFNDQQLASLADKLWLQQAGKNECLIEFGCSENYSLYLIEGTLIATAQDDRQNRYESGAGGELLPIAQIRPSLFRVVAEGPSQYIKIHADQLTEFAHQLQGDDGAVEVVEIEQSDEENVLTIQLFQDLMSGSLKLQSLPAFAKLGMDVLDMDQILEFLNQSRTEIEAIEAQLSAI